MSNQPHALYRFYAADGALLYVGITSNPGARWKKHRDEKPWWHEVRGISMEPYPSRVDVLAAETLAIAVENPRYNQQRPSLQRSKPPPGPTGGRALVWVCDACKQPVNDGAGYIHVEHQTVHDVRQAVRQWKAENPGPAITGAALFDYPAPARWGVHHAACDPAPESGDYWIDVKSARTHGALLARTAHLMGKAWLKHTDWDELIQRMSVVKP